MILISRTYETWTPDDIEAGDTDSEALSLPTNP
jgi:hypothetical protein